MFHEHKFYWVENQKFSYNLLTKDQISVKAYTIGPGYDKRYLMVVLLKI